MTTRLSVDHPVIKIMKLERVGVRAVCVTSMNAYLVEMVENGDYQFGEFLLGSCRYLCTVV